MKKILGLLIAVTVYGCSISPQLVNMIPDVSELSLYKSEKTITIREIIGGKEGEEWGSRISAADYLQVLQETIKQYQIFKLKYDTKKSDYILDILIIKQKQPIVGLDLTVNLAVEYKLYNTKGDVIWNEQIYTEYTARMCDSFVGASRLNIANEGAVRENVREAITKMANLKL
ncbi:MAG: hypothetical protein FJW56_03760 [Actinobacteria bacterium]|nr:hypothetical protein [Actinomycetota bacterium]